MNQWKILYEIGLTSIFGPGPPPPFNSFLVSNTTTLYILVKVSAIVRVCIVMYCKSKYNSVRVLQYCKSNNEAFTID